MRIIWSTDDPFTSIEATLVRDGDVLRGWLSGNVMHAVLARHTEKLSS